MENADVVKILSEIADILEILQENPFRIRSYRNAALSIENLPENLESIVNKGEVNLESIPGIGKSIGEKILEIVKTDKCQAHQELLKKIPQSMLELMRISSIGPKKVKLLHDELGIENIDQLEKAAKEEKIRALPGMGEKSEKKILKSIEEFKSRQGRFKLSEVIPYTESIIDYLKKEIKDIKNIIPAGSVRRWKETIGDVDILVTCSNPELVMKRFVSYGDVKEVLAKGETKSSIKLRNGLQVDLRVLEEENFGSAIQYFTGSKEHNVAIRDRAKKRGLKISEYGVFNEKTNKKIASKKEEEIYKSIGLQIIPPELRENRGEIESAEKGGLPILIELKDIKGDLHTHTKETDGAQTIDEMAMSAKQLGYEYIGITNHSKAVRVANGLDEKRLIKHMAEIEKVNKRLQGIKVLKGIEVDIMADGKLDLKGDVLKELDFVVATIHSRFEMPKDEMTSRIIKAIENEYVNIIAHPSGRLINQRPPYEVDMEKVIDSAKANGVFMELNAYPDRLDLNDIHCKMAKDKGVKVVISTDAHSTMQLHVMIYGVYTARRGWLEANDVLNTLELKDLLKMLKRH